MRRGYSPACSDSEVSCDGVQHPETLLSILQVFGQALLQDDINVFRVSIKGLQEVDNKWKLFHKVCVMCVSEHKVRSRYLRVTE